MLPKEKNLKNTSEMCELNRPLKGGVNSKV